MVDEIPARAMRLFGNDKARPKVVRVYNASTGWTAVPGAPVVTWAIVDELRRQGSTSVEVKWRFHTHQFSLLGMKLPEPDGSVEQTEREAGHARRGRGLEN